MTYEITTLIEGMKFLEGPRWHAGRIWFSDFYNHKVFSAEQDGTDLRTEAEVPGQPSGLGWLPDGRLLIVSMTDHLLLRREPDGSLVTHADLSGYVGGHLNDMVVDRTGRAFLGEFGFDLMAGANFKTANLIRVDPDGTATTAAGDMMFPNGSVITDDNTLLVCETFANRVAAFDITDGTLTNRRVWASFDSLGITVSADGCCLDAQGSMWIADATGNRVLQVQEGGEITDEIATPMGAFACMLGGTDGRTLFMCLAPDFFENARSQADEAHLAAVQVEVPRGGLP